LKVKEKIPEKTKAPVSQPARPPRETLITKICKIVIEDIRYKFGRKDTRTEIEKQRENEMIYKDFRERFG
jgi:hypothetical protein